MIRKKKTEKDDLYDQLLDMDDLDTEDLDSKDSDSKDSDSKHSDSKHSNSKDADRKHFDTEKSDDKNLERIENQQAPQAEITAGDTVDELSNEYAMKVEEKKISKKKIFLIAGAVVICLAGLITFIVKNINSGDEGKVYVESVSVLAGLGTVGANNCYTGVVEAQDSWKITLDADLTVEKCHVKVGDEVKKGDKLFTYNTEQIQLSLDKKNLELDSLHTEMNQLSKDIDMYEKDMKSASASEKIELQTQILTAKTTIKKDEYSVKSCEEEIEKLKKNIEDSTVTSKMDGLVKSINKKLGEMSSGDDEDNYSDESNNADNNVYMNILAIGDYRVKGKISETNMNSITEGASVIVKSRVDDNTWFGTISQVKGDETADEETSQNEDYGYYSDESSGEGSSNYNFYVELTSDEGLLMGQHVFVEMDNGQDDPRDGIWISSAYILTDGDDHYVWADNGHDRLEKRAVEVGTYDEMMDEYEIVSGLTAEDYIACDDIDLKAGMKTTKVDPFAENDEEFEDEDGEYYDEDGLSEGDDPDDEYTDDEDFMKDDDVGEFETELSEDEY